MPEFWAYWVAHRDESPDSQLVAFEAEFLSKHPALFSDEVIGELRKGQSLRGRARALLKGMPAREATMRRISDAIANDLTNYDATFRKAFPDMAWSGTVYFTLSLDAFDGAVRVVDGVPSLFFGIDTIARFHGDAADIEPLFHHELFHLHHMMKSPPQDYSGPGPFGLDRPLWSEGLAVYVAKTLNPNASLQQLVLTDEMVERTDANMRAVATELLTLLDQVEQAQYRDYFMGSGERSDIPERSGYYVGLRIVEHAAATRSLEELTNLQPEEIRAVVEAGLVYLQSA